MFAQCMFAQCMFAQGPYRPSMITREGAKPASKLRLLFHAQGETINVGAGVISMVAGMAILVTSFTWFRHNFYWVS